MEHRLNRQFASLQAFIDNGLSWLDERKLSLSIELDMESWVRHMRSAPGTDVVNPTFDPAYSLVDPGNSFWLAVRGPNGIAASIAARLFETDDYLDLKRSLKLWFDRTPRLALRIDLSSELSLPHIAGRVGHNGGLWVHPDWRKQGLSTVMPRLNRAFLIRQFDIDWDAGVTRGPLTAKGFPDGAYGYPHVAVFFEGLFPITGAYERMSICYADRREALESLWEPLPGSSATAVINRSTRR